MPDLQIFLMLNFSRTAVLPLRKLNPRERKWKKPRKRKKPRTKKKPRKIVQPSTPDTESALAVVAPQDRSMRNYTWSINKPRQSSLKQSQQVSGNFFQYFLYVHSMSKLYRFL